MQDRLTTEHEQVLRPTGVFPLLSLPDDIWPKLAIHLTISDFLNLSLVNTQAKAKADIGFKPLKDFPKAQVNFLSKVDSLPISREESTTIIELGAILNELRRIACNFPKSWKYTLLEKSLTQFLMSIAKDTVLLKEQVQNSVSAMNPRKFLTQLRLSAETYVAALSCRVLDEVKPYMPPHSNVMSYSSQCQKIIIRVSALNSALDTILEPTAKHSMKLPLAMFKINKQDFLYNWSWRSLSILVGGQDKLAIHIKEFHDKRYPLECLRVLWTELKSLPVPLPYTEGGDYYTFMAMEIYLNYADLANEIIEFILSNNAQVLRKASSTRLANWAAIKKSAGKPTEAIKLLEEAIKRLQAKPKNPFVPLSLEEEFQVFQFDDSADDLGEFCYQQPEFLTMWHRELCDLFWTKGDVSAAYDCLLKALDYHPNPSGDRLIHHWLADIGAEWLADAGALSILRKDFHAANKHYKAALNHPKCHMKELNAAKYAAEHGYVKIKLGDYKAADKLFDIGGQKFGEELPVPLHHQVQSALVKLYLNKVTDAYTLLQQASMDNTKLSKDWYQETKIGKLNLNLSMPLKAFVELMLSHLPDFHYYKYYGLEEGAEKLEWYALATVIKNYLDQAPEVQKILKEKTALQTTKAK